MEPPTAASGAGAALKREIPKEDSPGSGLHPAAAAAAVTTAAVDTQLHFKAKRSRTANACQMCKASHTSCDSMRPCGRCVKRGESHLCVDAPRKPSRKSSLLPSKSYVPMQPFPASSAKVMRPLLPKPAVPISLAPRPLLPANSSSKLVGTSRSLSSSSLDQLPVRLQIAEDSSGTVHSSFAQQQVLLPFSASLSSLFDDSMTAMFRFSDKASQPNDLEKIPETILKHPTPSHSLLLSESLDSPWMNALFDPVSGMKHSPSPSTLLTSDSSAGVFDTSRPHQGLASQLDSIFALPEDDIPAAKSSGSSSAANKKHLIPPCHIPTLVSGQNGFVYDNVDSSWLDMLMQTSVPKTVAGDTSVWNGLGNGERAGTEHELPSSALSKTETLDSKRCPVTLKTSKKIKRHPSTKHEDFQATSSVESIQAPPPSLLLTDDAIGSGVFFGDLEQMLATPAGSKPLLQSISHQSDNSLKTFSSSDVSAWIDAWGQEIDVDNSFGKAGCSVGCSDCPFKDDDAHPNFEW
ncbi:hypothetical protein HDU84_009530 [Entophlyctis sp. JEL0112]|nr:hypothetical protein HDU84_009530 [Entophlyctis sp. JEL0112]